MRCCQNNNNGCSFNNCCGWNNSGNNCANNYTNNCANGQSCVSNIPCGRSVALSERENCNGSSIGYSGCCCCR